MKNSEFATTMMGDEFEFAAKFDDQKLNQVQSR